MIEIVNLNIVIRVAHESVTKRGEKTRNRKHDHEGVLRSLGGRVEGRGISCDVDEVDAV